MKAGDTFIMKDMKSKREHLWVVACEPVPPKGLVVLVNFTKWRADKDQCCVLEPGDHAYIDKKTCVFYADARVVPIADVDMVVSRGMVTPHKPLEPGWLSKIQDGGAISEQTPITARDMLAEAFEKQQPKKGA